MYWQYRTILFEFQKDGLLGDKYVDDEEVDKVLNEQGEQGWELVGVTAVQEGLLTFFKRVRAQAGDQPAISERLAAAPGPLGPQRPVSISPAPGRNQREEERRPPAPQKKSSRIGEIKIS